MPNNARFPQYTELWDAMATQAVFCKEKRKRQLFYYQQQGERRKNGDRNVVTLPYIDVTTERVKRALEKLA